MEAEEEEGEEEQEEACESEMPVPMVPEEIVHVPNSAAEKTEESEESEELWQQMVAGAGGFQMKRYQFSARLIASRTGRLDALDRFEFLELCRVCGIRGVKVADERYRLLLKNGKRMMVLRLRCASLPVNLEGGLPELLERKRLFAALCCASSAWPRACPRTVAMRRLLSVGPILRWLSLMMSGKTDEGRGRRGIRGSEGWLAQAAAAVKVGLRVFFPGLCCPCLAILHRCHLLAILAGQ